MGLTDNSARDHMQVFDSAALYSASAQPNHYSIDEYAPQIMGVLVCIEGLGYWFLGVNSRPLLALLQGSPTCE